MAKLLLIGFDGIHHDLRGSTKKVVQWYVRHNLSKGLNMTCR